MSSTCSGWSRRIIEELLPYLDPGDLLIDGSNSYFPDTNRRSNSLAYFDGYRSAWLPASLMQAQRDYFGAHTYERVDKKEGFHTQWRPS